MAKRFLSLSVLERYMSADELAKFVATYNSHLQEVRAPKAATEQDKQVLADYQGGMKPKDLMKKYSLSSNGVSSAVMRAIKG